MMIRKGLLGLMIGAALSGCAAYPPLVVAPSVPAASPGSPTELDVILKEASTLQRIYADNYARSARVADLSQLPLIGAAAAAAVVLLNDKMNAAKVVGKIGIGAGAYSAARGQLVAAGLPEAYVAGHGALTCVLAEGGYFAGTDAERRRSNLDTALVALGKQIEIAQRRVLEEPTDAVTDQLKVARALVQQAVVQALAVEQTALNEQGADANAARVFRTAVSTISVRVASRGRVRPVLDYATLRDSLAPAPKKAVDLPPGQGGSDASSLSTTLTQDAAVLVRKAAAVTAATPHYSDSLTRVAACPALAG